MKKILAVETKLHLRDSWSMLFIIALPLLLLIVIGNIPDLGKPNPDLGGERFVDTQLPATMLLLALTTVALTVLPAVLATYRHQGVLRRMSTTPVSPASMLSVQLIINLGMAVIAAVVLILGARLVHGSPIPSHWAFVPVFLLGTAALMSIGLLIAALAPNAKSAPLIGNVIMFPMLFFAGMWIPRETMPPVLRTISDYSVGGPIVQAMRDTWAGEAPSLGSLAVIVVGLALFSALAVRLFRWQ
ncbi:ABC transporter permease [Nonomuraea soli]|uniref:Transport permease protein n=1 Tax=Nonomuraea soli TaxID=1032476 RepID=A0A7W0CIK9_9ACTN|nr:ABC transporter permease [Nonomuraea soli]MBA2891874.1 ABC-2 type transport system permease protein [Nonomuraea soli]